MDYKLPIAVNQRTINVLKNKVPRIQHSFVPTLHDEITTKLWGVLHPTYSLPQTNALLLDFLMDTEQLPKNMGSYNRENRIIKGVVGGLEGGIGAEYFFLDYLMRNSHQKGNYSLNHRKGPHILDHVIKADILTSAYRHDGNIIKRDTFGTQIQYCKLKKNYPEPTDNELRKERDILNGISMEQTIINALPEELRPEIPCLVRLNSEHFLAQIPELQQKRTFLYALEQRRTNGFHGGGPTQHLPDIYLSKLRQMSFFYQKSCISFLRFMDHLAEGKRTHFPGKNPSLTSHESAFRVNTYDSNKGRATYEFYHKTGTQQLFLTIVFRLPYETLDNSIDK